MAFEDERAELEEELEAYYSAYPSDLSAVEEELHRVSAEHPEWAPARRKAEGYAIVAERCRVKVFRHFPFYFELDTGRRRDDLGEGGVGGWMKREAFGQALGAEGQAWWQPGWESGLVHSWAVLDDNHHSIGNDNVFRGGLKGLIREAGAWRAGSPPHSETEEKQAFLDAAIAGNRALMRVAERFAEEAERLLVEERDPVVRERLERIATTARRVPGEAPGTFYEALNTLLFMHDVTQELEGNGNSILGHLDRILGPYYERDLSEGRITREEAKDLLRFFLALPDTRFGMREQRSHVGTNSTVVIGGCDATGRPVFNDLTRMILEVYAELRLVDPKLNARLSREHPTEFFELLAGLIASGNKSLAVFNDEVIIEANVRRGKAREDARLYVGGGCQENLLENTEINSRATMYLNLAQVLLMGFAPEQWAWFAGRQGVILERYPSRGPDGSRLPANDAGSHPCGPSREGFAELYEVFLRNLGTVLQASIDARNRFEREGGRYNPCPLHSSTISDCLANARDMFEGGARYSPGSVSLCGVGTLVDSLFALREVVYERGERTLARFGEILASDFAGEEAFRQYLVNRVAKFGQEDPAIREFSAQVFADLARVGSGQANTRGGMYEASLFSFRQFTSMGACTGATPDGRRAGEHLSPGMSPSRLALGERCGISQIMRALEPLDLTDYPVVAVLDLLMPATGGGRQRELLTPVLRRFLEVGGSVLQINCVDPAVLREAKAHPERHRDLVVRVSGYSSYFHSLTEEVQDEVIGRTMVEVG